MPAQKRGGDSGKYGFGDGRGTEIVSRGGVCGTYVSERDALLRHPGGDSRAGRHAELAQDVGDVGLDRPLADEELLGDRATALAGGDVRRHLTLPRCQPTDAGGARSFRREFRLVPAVTAGLQETVAQFSYGDGRAKPLWHRPGRRLLSFCLIGPGHG